MSQQKKLLAEAILKEVFGEATASAAGEYLCRWRKGSLRDLVEGTTDGDATGGGETGSGDAHRSGKVADALAVLIHHNLVTFSGVPSQTGSAAAPSTSSSAAVPSSTQAEYSLSLDAVIRILRYPRYLLQVKSALGDQAELLLDELIKSGQEFASKVILRSLLRRQRSSDGGEGARNGPPPSGVANGSTLSADAGILHRKFKDLVESRFVVRVPAPAKGSSIPVARASMVQDGDHPAKMEEEEEDLFELPDVKVSAIVAEAAKNTPDPRALKCADAEVFWRLNEAKFLATARDQVLVAAATRRIDPHAGRLLRIILDLVDAPWDLPVSGHFYGTDVYARVVAPSRGADCTETLVAFKDQYLALLAEDAAGFVRRVGDEGGGAFEVNFAGAFENLAAATVENVVLEKFSSKALRIFRVVRSRVYAEESQIQSMVMIPIKETKLLTYQLLENNFIHLQELRKSVGTNTHSKVFYLFYCDINRVARMVLEMCYKTIYNVLCRQSHEIKSNQRLLEKQERIESIADNIKKSCESEEDREKLDEQLQEIQEMLSPPETAQVRLVHRCLDRLRRAAAQVDETVFVIDMYLALATPT